MERRASLKSLLKPNGEQEAKKRTSIVSFNQFLTTNEKVCSSSQNHLSNDKVVSVLQGYEDDDLESGKDNRVDRRTSLENFLEPNGEQESKKRKSVVSFSEYFTILDEESSSDDDSTDTIFW